MMPKTRVLAADYHQALYLDLCVRDQYHRHRLPSHQQQPLVLGQATLKLQNEDTFLSRNPYGYLHGLLQSNGQTPTFEANETLAGNILYIRGRDKVKQS